MLPASAWLASFFLLYRPHLPMNPSRQSLYNSVYRPIDVTRHSEDNLSQPTFAEMKRGLGHPAVLVRLREPFRRLWSLPPEHHAGSFPQILWLYRTYLFGKEPLMAFLLPISAKGHIIHTLLCSVEQPYPVYHPRETLVKDTFFLTNNRLCFLFFFVILFHRTHTLFFNLHCSGAAAD